LNAGLLQGFYLSDLLIEPTKGRVTGREGSEHLASKAIEVLLCLASQPGELVSREELLETVWGRDEGSPEALSHAIGEIRHALHDHHDDPKYIQTLPKRGYRLLVTPVAADGATGTIVLGATNSVGADELGLFENLKQRGVLETALAYLIVGWLLIQIADIVFAQLFLPQWVGTFVTVLVIAGFPIAIALSWFLEFRDGRAVVHELSPKDARKRRFGRTYVSVIAALGIAAIVVFIYDKSIGLPEESVPDFTSVVSTAALPPVLENSIAVLPFVNIDGSDTTQIFANGLVDDVITRLSSVPGLLVSSRGDSFTLEPNSSSQKVRERLRVALYLEGSVQSAGDQLRVIVQLIDSDSGFHVLSRSFDRPRDDFFDIRDEITALTVANVRVALPADTQKASAFMSENPSIDAYVLYRRGVDASTLPGADASDTAVSWYNAALNVDPEYAAAHAGKCSAFIGNYFENSDGELIGRAESSCFRALELNPNLDVVHTALGNLYQATGQHEDALAAYRRALRINPVSVGSLTGMGAVYGQINEPDKAEQSLRQAIGLLPGDWSPYNALGAFLFNSGRYDEAAEQYEHVVALDSDNMIGYSNLGTAYMLAGSFEKAAPALQQAIDIEPRSLTYGSLGLMHYYLGDLDAAIRAHRNAINLAPNEPLTWSNLGDALWIAGREREARSAFESAESLALAALEVNPTDPYTQMDLAWISAMLGSTSDALDLIEAARPQLPDDPYAHYIDGLVHLKAGETAAALIALHIAVEKGYSLEMMAAEPHLVELRSNAEFAELIRPTENP
jgi:tetratricopeptide (TPR) repeat protein/DNA-binding winged helix-turn-helix (wHTH) protein